MLSYIGNIWVRCTYVHTNKWSRSYSEEGMLQGGARFRAAYNSNPNRSPPPTCSSPSQVSSCSHQYRRLGALPPPCTPPRFCAALDDFGDVCPPLSNTFTRCAELRSLQCVRGVRILYPLPLHLLRSHACEAVRQLNMKPLQAFKP